MVFPPEDYHYFQEKSQIYLGPPKYYKEDRSPGELTEVFVKKISHSTTMQALYEFVKDIGAFYQIRMPINLAQECKGYVYIRYFNQQDASRAVEQLNGKLFRMNHLEATLSWDNRAIQVMNWPVTLNQTFSDAIIRSILKNVTKVRIEMEPDGQSNRGYVIIEFVSHNAAAVGRRDIKNGALKHELLPAGTFTTNWTRYDFDLPEEVLRETRALYVNGIPQGTTLQELQEWMCRELGLSSVLVRYFDNASFAFIFFENHEIAAHSLEILKASCSPLNGGFPRAHWAKGPYSKKKNDRENTSRPNYERELEGHSVSPAAPMRQRQRGFSIAGSDSNMMASGSQLSSPVARGDSSSYQAVPQIAQGSFFTPGPSRPQISRTRRLPQFSEESSQAGFPTMNRPQTFSFASSTQISLASESRTPGHSQTFTPHKFSAASSSGEYSQGFPMTRPQTPSFTSSSQISSTSPCTPGYSQTFTPHGFSTASSSGEFSQVGFSPMHFPQIPSSPQVHVPQLQTSEGASALPMPSYSSFLSARQVAGPSQSFFDQGMQSRHMQRIGATATNSHNSQGSQLPRESQDSGFPDSESPEQAGQYYRNF